MTKHVFVVFTFFVCSLICFSGCVDFFQDIQTNKITYEPYPTQINYHLTYGYNINLSGSGESTVTYREDLPEVLKGMISNQTIINKLDAQTRTIDDNMMIFWNETFQDDSELFLGIDAEITSESMLTSDLSGSQALEISEIETLYPHLISQYCSPQKNETVTFIDPENPFIKNIAETIQINSDTNNSFLLGKDLFIWLKTNTSYQVHHFDQDIQPCHETLQKKTGDCDDLSFLYISLCRSVSIPARFVRGFLIDGEQDPVTITPHVWVEIYVGGNQGDNGWIPVECAGVGNIDAEVHQNFGVEDAHHLRLYVDNGSNESLKRYTNHISISYSTGIAIDLDYYSEITNYTVIESKNMCIENESTRSYC